MARIAIIVGSVRPHRLGPSIGRWAADVGRGVLDEEVDVIDLRDWPLPMDSEPGVPAQGIYERETTRAWSRKVASLAAVVFVTPQYNWGYPAALKNAIDHIYREWSGKPAMIVTYGGHAGDKCARQLREVLEAVRMRPVEAMPGFVLSRAQIEANSGEIDPAAQFGSDDAKLREAFGQLSAALAGG